MGTDQKGEVSGIAFGELVRYIEKMYLDEATVSVFKFSDHG